MLSKVASSTIFFLVFGMTRPVIEPRSPGPLANTLTIMPMVGYYYYYYCCCCCCFFLLLVNKCEMSIKIKVKGRNLPRIFCHIFHSAWSLSNSFISSTFAIPNSKVIRQLCLRFFLSFNMVSLPIHFLCLPPDFHLLIVEPVLHCETNRNEWVSVIAQSNV